MTLTETIAAKIEAGNFTIDELLFQLGLVDALVRENFAAGITANRDANMTVRAAYCQAIEARVDVEAAMEAWCEDASRTTTYFEALAEAVHAAR